MKVIVYLATCAVVAVQPFFTASTATPTTVVHHEFMSTFLGASLVPAEMSSGEKLFYADFPGAVGYFTLKNRPAETLFLRYTEKSTRLLHSVDICCRANGKEPEFMDNVRVEVEELSREILTWSQFRIHEPGGAYLVRQCIVSQSTGKTYADIPAWYWQTTFGSDDPGPWLAVTWQVPEEQSDTSR